MAERNVDLIVEGFSYTESPRWHEGELWFVDFYMHTVNKIDRDGTAQEICVVDGQPSGLGWLPDGRLLVVSMLDHRILRLEKDGTLVEHANIAHLCSGYPNDMVVAPNGNAYVGHLGFDVMGGGEHELAEVILVRPDGSSEIVGAGLSLPNGMAVSADEKRLIVNELFGNRISQFEIRDDGTLGERLDFADFGYPGDDVKDVAARLDGATISPDGLALDVEGAVWVADALNGRAVRIREGGEIVDEVRPENFGVFAIALGGEDGRSMYLCVAPDYDPQKRAAAREAGVAVVRVDVPGFDWAERRLYEAS